MSAHSGGTDWNSVVKPLLSNRTGALSKNEVANILKAIARCEHDFFDEDSNYAQFYTAFAALAADKLMQIKSICQTQISQLHDAAAVLIRFILFRLPKVSIYELKWLLAALKMLCEGKSSCPTNTAAGAAVNTNALSSFDYNAVANVLKSAKHPESSNKSIISSSSHSSSDKESPKSEIKRSRSDLSSIILHQLLAPLEPGKMTWVPLSEDVTDCTDQLLVANIAYFQYQNGVDTLLDVCVGLPILNRYRTKYLEAITSGKTLYLPLTQVEATTIKSAIAHMSTDLSILMQAHSLIGLQPLTPSRIEKLSMCGIAALYNAVLTSIAASVLNMSNASGSQKQPVASTSQGGGISVQTPKDHEDFEEQACAIVNKALEIYATIGEMFKSSARTYVYQNHLCYGSWLLISGIQGAMGASGSSASGSSKIQASDDAGKAQKAGRGTSESGANSATPSTPIARVNLFKVQQGFGELNAAIANQSIKLLSELIDDLKIESACYSDGNDNDTVVEQFPEPAQFNILQNYTSLQRVVRVLNTATLHQLFTFLATVAYRKACTLKRATIKDRTECEPISYSDSTTYFNDSLSCSDNSEEDDSESYLGHWFKETLSPEMHDDNANAQALERNAEQQKSALVPKLDEPHEYLDLAADIFCFLDQFLANTHGYLQRYVKAGVSDQQMLLMANIIKDFDRDVMRNDSESISSNSKWHSSMIRFSGAAGRYIHNLISTSLLSEQLQSNLLQHLAITPWSTETSTWPLQVYPSTLSVLVQILLLKPTQEKEAACLSVWHRLINTLVEGVCSASASDTDYEDLNIEHAQLLLFLFHSLNLMQKKSILLLTAGGVIRCADVCRGISAERPVRNSQMMLLSRLLLFLEYLMKHLYNAPPELLDQVRWNLFSVSSMPETQKVTDLLNSRTKFSSYCRNDIEEKFRKSAGEYSSNIRPTFYSLVTSDPCKPHWAQEFKLDGLAWNFILCTPDKLKYPLLVDALTDILAIADMSAYTKDNIHNLCAMQYCFSIAWKLLLGLPPSTSHMESLTSENAPNLHSLIWSIRCPLPSSYYLIVNSLIKQGMYTQYAESLWSKVGDLAADMRYSLKQTILGVEAFNKQFNKEKPRLSDLILFDALVAHMQAVAWADKEGYKLQRKEARDDSSVDGGGAQASVASSSISSTEKEVYSSNESIDQKKSKLDNSSLSPAELKERTQMVSELLLKLMDSYSLIIGIVRDKMLKQLSSSTPEQALNLIVPIVSDKPAIMLELHTAFLKLLPNEDKQLIANEWPKCLVVSEVAFDGKQHPVEPYTLTLIDSHISELTKASSYSTLHTMKNCLKSILHLIELLLPYSADGENHGTVKAQLKPLLIATMLDIRTDYLQCHSEQCLREILSGMTLEAQKMLLYEHMISYCYRMLIDFAEELRVPQNQPEHRAVFNESMLFAVLRTLTKMIEKPTAVVAMRNFFKEQRNGSFTELLLSFTGTTLPMSYARKMLQFVERLFQQGMQPESEFPHEELVQCFAELGSIDVNRLKLWLTHIIYGPNGSLAVSLATNATSSEGVDTCKVLTSIIQPSSTSSSNAQTPTNMATVSAMPSISDQLDAMDIDYDCAGVPPNNSNILSLWQAATGSAPNQSEDSSQACEQSSERNGALLLSFVKSLVRDGKAATGVIAPLLFQALLQLGQTLITPPQDGCDFADVLQIMITLADAAPARGHVALFNTTLLWLEIAKLHVADKQNLKNAENISALLKYLSELLQSIGFKGSRQHMPPWDDELQTDIDELYDELAGEEDDSLLEDSDEDTLNNKLCTFSQTQKEFMNQHWYHCHTCNMINTVGVCSVCARVCHKGHDVSYAKYGNFFCDCGAKEDGSCQALSRRIASHGGCESRAMADYGVSGGSSGSYVSNMGLLSSKKRSSAGAMPAANSHHARKDSLTNERIVLLGKLLESHRDALQHTDQWLVVVRCILEYFDVLLPAIKESCTLYSIVGCHKRATAALERLHQLQQSFQVTDQLMFATLGSQEGAFENVRMNYSGDQGQTIKHLISSGVLRRVAFCCLSSPHGRRQHLAVSHEKGKVTILQLSALLRQADASKRKLTLTQLSSAPISCTVLSLTANPCNEDCLAVCGLKECHVLTFSNSGSTNEHIVVTPHLENGNYIKKAVWLPGSQTMLALVTSDYVKIYDLSEDAYSPKYYYLVAVGTIRDCTFIYQEGAYYMLAFASSGYIYYQILDEQSLAVHGDFYVTNTLELSHQYTKDVNGQVGGGGVSIYYSHALQLLFYSYSVGRSFVSPLVDVNKGVKGIYYLETNPTSKSSSKGPMQPLVQWTEISGHPGLIYASMQTSNNPIIFMFTPERIYMQEIKAQSAKSRIMDVVGIRHAVAGTDKTTLLLLCEDGSLRIFSAQPDQTSFWLSPQVQPFGNQLYSSTLMAKSISASNSQTKKSNKRKSSQQQKTMTAAGVPVFPIDFFEHCNMLADVEFGGNDMLQIYNKQKLKTRLFSTGMFVASTRPNGFTLEVINNDPNIVMVGIRVLLGTQDTQRAPQSVTILGRTIPTVVRKARWFDIPLTREEMLVSDKLLKVMFSKSQDPENVTLLDCIEVYGKSKDLVGWPDDNEETAPAGNAGTATVPSNGQNPGQPNASVANFGEGFNSITQLDRMVTHLLEVLDCALHLLNNTSSVSAPVRQKAIKTASALLLLPTPNPVQTQARYVLATLYGNRSAYHSYKDGVVLSFVHSELQSMHSQLDTLHDIDPEALYRLILLVRGIANTRPQSLTKICLECRYDIVPALMSIVTELYKVTPAVDEPTNIVRRGLCQTETMVHCLVEIMYGFALADSSQVGRMTNHFIELLRHDATVISHSAKEALILLLSPRVKRRKVALVTPPACSTPTPSTTISATNLSALSGAAATAAHEIIEEAAAAAVDVAMAGASGGSGTGAEAGAGSRNTSAPAAVAAAAAAAAVRMPEFADGAALDPEAEAGQQQLLNLEAFMGGSFPRLLGLPEDADDEAIMDIAIALSLQQHEGDANALHSLQQGLANLQGIRNAAANAQNADAMGGLAVSVSAGGSDDEGSNVATDGSTLRTSPAEPAGSGGSESGGSGVESIGGTSARSSNFGDHPNASPPQQSSAGGGSGCGGSNKLAERVSEDEQPSSSGGGVVALSAMSSTERDENEDNEDEKMSKLHDLRIAVLESIIEHLNTFDQCNGIQAIPLIQVILMLTTDLNGNNERDQKVLNELLIALVEYVEIGKRGAAAKMKNKCASNEVRLALLSLFGVMMGKTKSKQTGTTSPPHQFKDNSSFVASTTANVLSKSGAFVYALEALNTLLVHWKDVLGDPYSNTASTAQTSPPAPTQNAAAGAGQTQLLKPIKYGPKPDISILIPHNYLKNYPDIFESYDALLTEIIVRLPYQILRLCNSHPDNYDSGFCEAMTFTLCEYMMLNLNALLRRQVRKLLMYICGNKEKFRMYRDGHSLDAHFRVVKRICNIVSNKNGAPYNMNPPILGYDALVELTEHLRTCQEISQMRTGNWQKFCVVHEDALAMLMEIACYQLDDGVSPIIIHLLQAAVCNMSGVKQQAPAPPPPSSSQPSSKLRSEREKSEDTDAYYSKFDPAQCTTFVHQIFRYASDALIIKFVRIFLLDNNISMLRWQAHSFIHGVFENSNERQREKLLNLFWNMWPLVPVYGRRTAQFVDLLGYLTLSTRSITDRLPEFVSRAVDVLRQQNDLLCKHPNAPIYTTLEQILQVNGYYLESEPCLVCNNPEVPMTNIKVPSVKSDSKYTTTTMIYKLVQCHTISKLVVRIADLKRTKMVRTINVYYNNRTVQAVVELKNRPALWHKARSVSLQSGQTELKIDFPLPITACNLMIEFADFYETVTGSSENLQCPRCSAAVPAYPGVCGNCGENVFQCHKCRAINYDEKDPFLCHSCGFCKYAKFDFSMYARVCCAVDPIESAEDRAKTVQIIHTSLERADRIYRQLLTNKQMLELLIQKVAEHRSSDRLVDDNMGTVHSTSQVNKIIQLLAQKYCVESRTSFEELSKIVQKVKACRSELVAYDRQQQDQPNCTQTPDSREIHTANRCYGCALASTEQCLTLLRAMAYNYDCRIGLYSQGLVNELAEHNLRRGTPQIQEEVRNLLVVLTKDNSEACINLLNLVTTRVKNALMGAIPLISLEAAVHQEMTLLEVLLGQDDVCWEFKLKIIFELFISNCRLPRGPVTSVLHPCLRIMQNLICPTLPISKSNQSLAPTEMCSVKILDGNTIDYRAWLSSDRNHEYSAWSSRMPPNFASSAVDSERQKLHGSGDGKQQPQQGASTPATQTDKLDPKTRRQLSRAAYLQEKYGRRWQELILDKMRVIKPLVFTAKWIQPLLFNPNSRFGRQLACSLLTALTRTNERKQQALNMLTSFLKCVGEAGEASAEYLTLYRTVATETPWLQYLVLRGVLGTISQLLAVEIGKIHRMEENSLSSDLSLGYALRQYVELLCLFLESPNVRRTYKTRMLGPVLESYLALRSLVVQRTRLIDDAQDKLLDMLEEMTSGTEEETRAFMEILIDTVEKTRMNDIKTPVFIFERLYSIIHPEENDESEFYMTLEKDPQQEDFLQGRMLGNPYPSGEVGLGPLMRDVKNKICTDCELIALLEDDNGMELLVNNKIISLDLPVKDVYKKVWLAEGGDRDAMRIVYRMRGLLGDATEEFVETLNNKSQEEVDTEQLYRMANVLADCNGLRVMLERIGSLQRISRNRELIQVLLKLFLICVKVRRCQKVLCQPEVGAINTLLKVLQMCLQSENDSIQSAVTEQLLEIMETILSKASSDTLDSFLQFSLTFGGPEYVTALISCTDCPNVRNNPSVLRHLIRVLAALVYGNEVKMALLCEHFKNTLDFNHFDQERTSEEEFRIELFCVLTNQIEHNCIGGTLKDYIVSLGIVERALAYITEHAPCVKPTLLRTDSDELKEFISRPSLKYILRFLTGLANHHEATQLAISKDIIPIIHRLEQVSSDEHVGSLAENLLEALSTDSATATRVQEVRDFTRAEKKRLAMATREKQLDALGMRTNEKGQVTAKGSILQKIEKLRDETGLTCFICREGYACQPEKVLGIYTFTKRCNVEEFELKSRKTVGYTTVTHFNVVHVDCHTSAIRLTRGRDEWERASLQNANTRCNGLLPLWGPNVTEAAFSGCMTRHSSYMQESTQRCDISYTSSVHDLKLLLMRFAWERSFHDDAGGGGPQSNMHFVPYLLFYAVYLLLSSRSAARDSKTLLTYLTAPPSDKWLECGYEVDGPLYMITISLSLHSRELWNKHKVSHLKRLLAVAQARHVSPSVLCKALLTPGDRQTKEYNVYKPFLMMWAVVDLIYNTLFKTVSTPKEEDWSISLFDFIRKNDEVMLKSTDNILQTLTDEFMPCTSFGEFCDVAGLLHLIEQPDSFIDEMLAALPSTASTSS
ncbi:protein purity of essence [Scaptodrosophila lebanonensis]|uniref:Protein purity of essence n=1 Tax=Drosophila lebanonensis TaxID=7225 RepID=A0A6J2UC29_DROLE|nr:protein purity of essence [Scaptodrosophila lebanonensis]